MISAETGAQPPAARGATAPKADAATVALAKALMADVKSYRYFEGATLEKPGALAALGYLALTASDPALVGQAYDAMERQLDALASAGKLPDQAPALATQAVVAALALDRADRKVLAEAIPTASALNRGAKAHAPSLEALARMAGRHQDPDVRHAALSQIVMVSVPVARESTVVAEALVRSLDDPNDYVAAIGLFNLGQLGSLPVLEEPARAARIEDALKRLRSSRSSGLRATAMSISAKRLGPGPVIPGLTTLPEPTEAAKALSAELMAALTDPAPLVRGVAASSLGVMAHREAVPKLARLLADRAEVSAEAIGGVRSLADDTPLDLPARVAGLDEPQTVAMGAFNGLMLLSMIDEPESSRWLRCEDATKAFAPCAKRAQDWAAKRR
jgi:HEAT repeat protein